MLTLGVILPFMYGVLQYSNTLKANEKGRPFFLISSPGSTLVAQLGTMREDLGTTTFILGCFLFPLDVYQSSYVPKTSLTLSCQCIRGAQTLLAESQKLEPIII